MQIKIEVPAKRIAEIMISAVEHNHMTRAWCAGVFIRGQWEKKLAQLDPNWYADPKVYADEFTIEVQEIEDEAKPDEITKHRLNQADFAKGIALMAKEHGEHFGNWMSESDDNITADVFLQCVALGEVRYG